MKPWPFSSRRAATLRRPHWWPPAQALYVSPNTVKTHVASLLNKLDADNRAQLAAIATTHGIHPPRRDRRHDYAASR
jgi:hypothetical protein